MLTSRQAFQGQLATEVLASVIAKEPDYTTLQTNLHPAINKLLRRCLEKEPKNRWQAVGDLRFEIEQVLADPSGALVQPVTAVVQAAPQSKLPWVAAIVLGVLITGVTVWNLRPAPEPGRVSRFDYDLLDGQAFRNRGHPVFALSPDGRRFVYNTIAGLFLREMDELGARIIPGTEGNVANPFFSSDGQWVGYWIDGQLMKIAIIGGAPIRLAEVARPFGVSWEADGTILLAQPGGIRRVSENGGETELIVEARDGEQMHGPQLLSGGEWVLFTTTTVEGESRWDQAQIVAESLESHDRVVLWEGGSDAQYVPTGHLVYALEDGLFAVPFDLESLRVTGGAVSITEGVMRSLNPQGNTATANYGLSRDGSLVYVEGSELGGDLTLALVDSDGVIEGLNVPSMIYNHPRVSPDGTQVAVSSFDEGDARGFVWVYDLSGDTTIRQLTFDRGNVFPIWTPDGEWITFASNRDTEREDTASIYRTRADGSGVAERLTTAEEGEFHFPESYSGDGRLSFRANVGGTNGVWTLSGEDGAEPEVFIVLPESNQGGSVFSPDGNWIAYQSNESGE